MNIIFCMPKKHKQFTVNMSTIVNLYPNADISSFSLNVYVCSGLYNLTIQPQFDLDDYTTFSSNRRTTVNRYRQLYLKQLIASLVKNRILIYLGCPTGHSREEIFIRLYTKPGIILPLSFFFIYLKNKNQKRRNP